MTKYYITTPLYYVNAKPHIGHAYTNVLCDTFARFHKLRGEEVFFLTGTDEHGTKIEKVAREQGQDAKTYVDRIVPEFKSLWQTLGIQYDYFIRTTDDSHKQIVGNILRDLETKGEIYKASYKGWYCTPCESFWTELQLVQGKCPDCSRDVQELSEDNYFFKLSKYQDWLIQYIQDTPGFIQPDMRKNEILGFLREPLEDLCITRPRARLAWGIDYPTSPEHVVYVWFDALINYVSAVGYSVDNARFQKLWPADVHVVGKDILRQHAVYWPIMLKAMGAAMPKKVLAHGWWTMGGAKVSKSRGNAVDPEELVKKYGVDAFRYFLLHEVTLGMDGAFSEDLLAERYVSDLANNLGNLWFRCISMLHKYFEGKMPRISGDLTQEKLLQKSFALMNQVNDAMLQYDPRGALDFIGDVATRANQFVEENKPWVLAKDPAKKEDLAKTMAVLTECLAHIAYLLQPFMPATAQSMLSRLQINPQTIPFTAEGFSTLLVPQDIVFDRGEALFPKLEEKEKA